MTKDHILALLKANHINLSNVDESLIDDDIIRCALKVDGLNYQNLSNENKAKHDYAMLAFRENKWVYSDFPSQFLDDAYFLEQAILSKRPSLFHKTPQWVRSDEALVKKALQTDAFNYVYIDKSLQQKIYIIKLCLNTDPDSLRLMDKKYLDNFDLVMMAVSQKASLIQYASENIRNHPKMMRMVCERDIRFVKYAGQELKDNRDFVKFLFNLNEGTEFISHLSDDLKQKLNTKNPKATFMALLEKESLENKMSSSNEQKNKIKI